MKKRLLAIFLTLVMILPLLPTAALATEDEFVIQGTRLIQYNGPGGDVVIPEGVTEVAATFDESITSVTFPASMIMEAKYYHPGIFDNCPNLTAFYVDPANERYLSVDGVLYRYRYNDSNKDDLVLVDYPTGKSGSFTVPANVVLIMDTAFEKCVKLTEIRTHMIPAGATLNVTGCKSLKGIHYTGNEENYYTKDGVLFYINEDRYEPPQIVRTAQKSESLVGRYEVLIGVAQRQRRHSCF